MNRIDKTFRELKSKEKKAFITFVTAGDPDLETTKELILEMERQGADLIELGIPFSDPIAEGPVIQEANVRSLIAGTTPEKVFSFVQELRKETQIPLVFLLYYNTIFAYGAERFFARCKECGTDGVIIPDLPFEESGEIAEYTEKYDVHHISMVSPTSTHNRLKQISKSAKGFIYCISSMDTTKTREYFNSDFGDILKILDNVTDVPKCICSSISCPEHIRLLKDYSDGLIVDSAIVRTATQETSPSKKVAAVGKFTAEMKSAF